MLSTGRRLGFAAAGCALLGLLLVARLLSPSSAGQGTHRQLGLPPCTVVVLLGVPCPTCGMTTSWSHLTRGQFVESWRCNPGGLMLGFVAAACGVWSLSLAVKGRYWSLLSDRASLILATIIGAITILDWGWRVFLN